MTDFKTISSHVLYWSDREPRPDARLASGRAGKQAREFDPGGDFVRRRVTVVAAAAAAVR